MITTRQAVIDIGSNAIRLVVYAGALRAPMPIYNEKSRVSLGSCLAKGGEIDAVTMERALSAIARYHRLAMAMDVDHLRIVATAATRDSSNGHELVTRAQELGIGIEVLDGKTEAYLSGLGIISEHPAVDGYVGDLGGGSLELARLINGRIEECVSLPFGTLRLEGFETQDFKSISDQISSALTKTENFPLEQGLPFFLVGGAWRALARLHIHHNQFPLSVLSSYIMSPTAPADFLERSMDSDYLLANKVVPSARVDALPGALALLGGVVRLLEPSTLITSTSGLREGLLFDRLTEAERQRDPFVEAARYEGARLARFPFHGDALADWIAPLFADEGARFDRLRRVACLLADTAWNMTPEYRSDVAVSLALDGSWPGATAEDRAILAAALLAVHDHRKTPPDSLHKLAEPDALSRAVKWGMAIRLAYRLDGGTGSALSEASLEKTADYLNLWLSRTSKNLFAGSVERRLQQLANALGYAQAAVLVRD